MSDFAYGLAIGGKATGIIGMAICGLKTIISGFEGDIETAKASAFFTGCFATLYGLSETVIEVEKASYLNRIYSHLENLLQRK